MLFSLFPDCGGIYRAYGDAEVLPIHKIPILLAEELAPHWHCVELQTTLHNESTCKNELEHCSKCNGEDKRMFRWISRAVSLRKCLLDTKVLGFVLSPYFSPYSLVLVYDWNKLSSLFARRNKRIYNRRRLGEFTRIQYSILRCALVGRGMSQWEKNGNLKFNTVTLKLN